MNCRPSLIRVSTFAAAALIGSGLGGHANAAAGGHHAAARAAVHHAQAARAASASTPHNNGNNNHAARSVSPTNSVQNNLTPQQQQGVRRNVNNGNNLNNAMRRNAGVGNNMNRMAAMNRHSTGQVVQALHQTINELHRADHDYNGNRGRAISELHSAIRSLTGQRSMNNNYASTSHHQNNARASMNVGLGAGLNNFSSIAQRQRMPQAQSDQHLRNAMQSLQQIEPHLTGNGNNSTHTHAAAAQHVMRAYQHLGHALSMR